MRRCATVKLVSVQQQSSPPTTPGATPAFRTPHVFVTVAEGSLSALLMCGDGMTVHAVRSVRLGRELKRLQTFGRWPAQVPPTGVCTGITAGGLRRWRPEGSAIWSGSMTESAP